MAAILPLERRALRERLPPLVLYLFALSFFKLECFLDERVLSSFPALSMSLASRALSVHRHRERRPARLTSGDLSTFFSHVLLLLAESVRTLGSEACAPLPMSRMESSSLLAMARNVADTADAPMPGHASFPVADSQRNL